MLRGGGGDGSGRLARFFTFYMHLFCNEVYVDIVVKIIINNNFTIRRTFLAGIQAPLYHPILNAQAKVPEGGGGVG